LQAADKKYYKKVTMWKAAAAILCLLIPLKVNGQQPAAPSDPQPVQKPHLIELTSDNWRPLSNKEKFQLFERDLLHWGTHASLLFDSGISAALADRRYLGVGASGYFRTYGLNVADESNFVFFNGFLFPTLFHEDPRYIPLDHGSVRQRLVYSLTRTVVARSDSGKSKFNESRLLGTLVSTSMSSAYYSGVGADVSVKGNFAGFGINIASEAAFDLLKEFWPDVARKLKLNVWIRNAVRRTVRDSIKIN
jgi:hypothetical protein